MLDCFTWICGTSFNIMLYSTLTFTDIWIGLFRVRASPLQNCLNLTLTLMCDLDLGVYFTGEINGTWREVAQGGPAHFNANTSLIEIERSGFYTIYAQVPIMYFKICYQGRSNLFCECVPIDFERPYVNE